MNHASLYSPAAERDRTLAGTHFPSAKGRRLSWSELHECNSALFKKTSAQFYYVLNHILAGVPNYVYLPHIYTAPRTADDNKTLATNIITNLECFRYGCQIWWGNNVCWWSCFDFCFTRWSKKLIKIWDRQKETSWLEMCILMLGNLCMVRCCSRHSKN